jgi:hypothetical protein
MRTTSCFARYSSRSRSVSASVFESNSLCIDTNFWFNVDAIPLSKNPVFAIMSFMASAPLHPASLELLFELRICPNPVCGDDSVSYSSSWLKMGVILAFL